MSHVNLSIIIPTYGRDRVLCDTIAALLVVRDPAGELLVIDQTTSHDDQTQATLSEWHNQASIRWIRHQPPGVVGAMNRGLREATGDIVLFLDDDIIPHGNLVVGHRQAHSEHPEAWAVVGQVIQGEDRRPQTADRRPNENINRELSEFNELREEPQKTHPPSLKLRRTWKDTEVWRETEDQRLKTEDNSWLKKTFLCILRILRLTFPSRSALRRDLDFKFNGTEPAWVENVMAGNLSVRREKALALGGFDENFVPPVSFRFETEFAKRVVLDGGKIWFEPKASILHLRAASGGTRSKGGHMASASPLHGGGDYYFALKHGKGIDRVLYMAWRPIRQIRTKFHLRHPWWIPIKFVGELRAIWMALQIWRISFLLRASQLRRTGKS